MKKVVLFGLILGVVLMSISYETRVESEETKKKMKANHEGVIGGPKPFVKQSELIWEPAGENVRRQIMGWNEQSMMVRVEFLKSGAIGSVHAHPHLQNSYVAAGKFEATIGGEKTILQAGDGYFVEPDVPHGVVCLEPGTLIDVFTPYRADFISKD